MSFVQQTSATSYLFYHILRLKCVLTKFSRPPLSHLFVKEKQCYPPLVTIIKSERCPSIHVLLVITEIDSLSLSGTHMT